MNRQWTFLADFGPFGAISDANATVVAPCARLISHILTPYPFSLRTHYLPISYIISDIVILTDMYCTVWVVFK